MSTAALDPRARPDRYAVPWPGGVASSQSATGPAATPPRAALSDPLGRGTRRALLALMVLLHLLVGALLWQQRRADVRRQALPPLQLSVIPASRPAPPPPPALRAALPELALAAAPVTQLLPVPQLQLVETAQAAPVSPSAARPTLSEASPSVPAPTAPAEAAVAPPSRPQLPASAVRYLVEPRLHVPLLSRRLREQGVVHLRLVIDASGRLVEATLKQSSGYARLDQQALIDIRSARFSPYQEQGRAIEWETTALLSYEVDR